MKDNYKIRTNPRGRKILTVKGVVPIDTVNDIKAEDFDAIFVEDANLSHNELAYILQHLSPFRSQKCMLKPRFLHTTLRPRALRLEPLIDGYAQSLEDKNMCEEIEEIYSHLNMIDTYDTADVKNNSYMFFLKLCKFAISRGEMTFTISTEPAYAMGHTALYLAKQNNMHKNSKDDFIHFNHLLVELGYAKKKDFIERIHVCPHCRNSYLFYMECCPKCQSSHLKEEPVLHHFRCANISPESSYAYDGELRCPKCHQFLRHIGVDYDRPSNVYTCQECNHTFLHTQMKVFCSSCKKMHRPSELLAQDLYSYEFTSEGIMALTSNDAVIAVSKDIWAGYSPFESFLTQIQLFSYSQEKNETIYIHKAKITGANANIGIIKNILTDLQKRYHYNNLSYKGNYIFMASKASAGMSDELWNQVNEEQDGILKIIELKYDGIQVTNLSHLRQEADESANSFIERLCKEE